MGDYSRLLTKMEELKSISGDYQRLIKEHKPAYSTQQVADGPYTDKYTPEPDKNAISNTKMPLVIRPGEDYGEFWKYIGKVTDDKTSEADVDTRRLNSARKCWSLAATNPMVFKKVVYTGINNTNQPEWNNRCYGLVPDAPPNSSYNTSSSGYVTMTGNGTATASNGIYTKLGIKNSDLAIQKNNLANAMRINDIQQRVNALTSEIVAESDAGINNELNLLTQSASDSKAIIGTMNDYMNNSAGDIKENNKTSTKRKELGNIYAEINEQSTLRSRKYQFIFYIVIAISIIIGYGSYTSKIPLLEQFEMVKNYFSWGWWRYWFIATTVVLIFIVSSIGFDVKGHIMTAIEYLSDPEFWTGQLWWVGISFLLLIIIFFYATFKSFFSGIGDSLTKTVEGNDDSN
jgi:hypothetical protein